MSNEPTYEHGEPMRKINEYRAKVAAKTMTEEAAIDEMFAWAQRVGWEVTRSSVESDISGKRGKMEFPPYRDDSERRHG
jgi:predicted rRNA methylase YqxC with S4 and FtsJ domains